MPSQIKRRALHPTLQEYIPLAGPSIAYVNVEYSLFDELLEHVLCPGIEGSFDGSGRSTASFSPLSLYVLVYREEEEDNNQSSSLLISAVL